VSFEEGIAWAWIIFGLVLVLVAHRKKGKK
jgi:hypothetical protein